MQALDRFRLDGRTALVTGASSGIGAVLALGLAQAGATVIAAARRADRLQRVVSDIVAAGGKAHAVALDVTAEDSIRAAFDHAEALAGIVDVLINNAGVAEPSRFVTTEAASRDHVMATNFNGVWNVTQEAARRLLAAKRPGSIINIASVLGIGAGIGYASYSASKAAVIQLTRVLALELGRSGIRVNSIAPGWFVTEMNDAFFASDAGKALAQRSPAGRTGELHELLGPVVLLASDAGSYINGVVLPVDGAH
ncbi:MAG: SDR family oxidoreductase, partial [Pseudomonadales bacterium]|nr:SDR family oxidoreductase [Pseudomonadales bacterium]